MKNTYVMVANAGRNTVLREGKTVEGLYSSVKDVCNYCYNIIIFDKESHIVKYEWNVERDIIIERKDQFAANQNRMMDEKEEKLYRWALKWHPDKV